MSLSLIANSIGESATLKLNEVAATLRAKGDPEIHLGLGSLAAARGDAAGAVAAYRQALTLDPGFAMAHYNLANLYLRGGEGALAEEHYLRYLERLPDSAAAANNLAKVYEMRGRYHEAERLYRRAIANAGDSKALYQKNYARLLERDDRWDDASKVYKKLMTEQPLSPRQHEQLAAKYRERGLAELAGWGATA